MRLSISGNRAMDAARSHRKAHPEIACHVSRATIRNWMIFALCFYGVLGVIAGLIWG
jgi:L-rhamnose mutarotase